MTIAEIAHLVPWHRVFGEVDAGPGHGKRTSCSIHRGDNPTAFSYNDDTGRARCFSCGWHVDKVDFLPAAFGLNFKATLARLASIAGIELRNLRKPSSLELARARAHRAALDAARVAYSDWQRARLVKLSDEYRELIPEIEIAEVGYRATRRRPDLYSEDEARYWETHLAAVYDRLSELEYSLDLLTLRKFEAERFSWWRGEVECGRLAA